LNLLLTRRSQNDEDSSRPVHFSALDVGYLIAPEDKLQREVLLCAKQVHEAKAKHSSLLDQVKYYNIQSEASAL